MESTKTPEKLLTRKMFFATQVGGPRGRIRAIRNGHIIEIHGVQYCQGCLWHLRISGGKADLCKTCQPQRDEAGALIKKLSKKYGIETHPWRKESR